MRQVKIYRKLLYKITQFCSDQKWRLNRQRFSNDNIFQSNRKFDTDFEKGWFDGYHAAMNDVLREVEERNYWSQHEWNNMSKETRLKDR